jgi:hypothetical protein
MAENFIRSANAPTISAGVMIANVIWKMKNRISGIDPDRTLPSIPRAKNLPKPPTNEWRLVSPATMPVASNARL